MHSNTKTGFPLSGCQYSLFRALFGSYLTVHFGYLMFYAIELFSSQGMLPSASLSPLFAITPGLLHISDAPPFVLACVASGVVAAVCFALGRCDRLCAAWLLLLLASLFARNPLIANPALPYLGFMLLLHLFVPPAPYGSLAAAGRANPAGDWRMPRHLFLAVSIVLALSYSYSGYTKLLSPGWVAGDTVGLVLHNPLARDWFIRDLFLTLPDIALQAITWFILLVELLFAPLYLLRSLRFGLWFAMSGVQFGFLLLLSFPDLTIPMLLFHLLTFDPRWLPARKLAGATLHYDGECGLCHGAVRFALAECNDATLLFRPMQLDHTVDLTQISSWQLLSANGQCYEKTAALARLLEACGGSWRAVGIALRYLPRRPRDAVYDLVARHRRLFPGKPAELCPLVAPELRQRFA